MSGRIKDLAGKKFGELTVLSFAGQDVRRKARWLVKCSCGAERIVDSSNLLTGHTKTCGHINDLTGLTFGKLLVLHRAENDAKNHCRWMVRCSGCGTEKVVGARHLLRDSTKSCGRCWQMQDLVGQKFGMLVVVKMLTGLARVKCLVRCDCGNERRVVAHSLKSGKCLSCGCLKSKKTAERNKSRTNKLCSLCGMELVTGESRNGRCNLCRRINIYGLTKPEYERMFNTQGGKCKIDECDRAAEVIDHCHKTGKVRGLLCSTHNKGLGHFNDDPEELRRAAAYLESVYFDVRNVA